MGECRSVHLPYRRSSTFPPRQSVIECRLPGRRWPAAADQPEISVRSLQLIHTKHGSTDATTGATCRHGPTPNLVVATNRQSWCVAVWLLKHQDRRAVEQIRFGELRALRDEVSIPACYGSGHTRRAKGGQPELEILCKISAAGLEIPCTMRLTKQIG